MKVLFVTSECAPFSKSGGLADVAFSLPPALKELGDQVAIVTPYYSCVREKYADRLTSAGSRIIWVGYRRFEIGILKGELDGVPVWFIANDEMFNRPKLYGYYDDPVRFALFSKAVTDTLGQLGFMPDILHCNDWETALAVLYLKDMQVRDQNLKCVKTVFTIHNIAYQGQYGRDMMEALGLDPGWYEGGLAYVYENRQDINLMKGAMLMADAVSTVSPNYARELHYPEFAHGLQGVVDIVDHKLYGILNGINVDHYNPAKDPLLIANFDTNDFVGKALCKHEIQRIFGLDEEIEYPLLASVARLVEQKGIELVKQVLPGLMDLGVQLIVFGQGEQQYVDYFNWAKANWPGQVGFSSNYTEEVASLIFAGADMYLMPSRFEPCGLSQMMAMRYGTVPIVHETGGLKDSVRGYKEFDGIGDGFSFMDYSGKGLYLAVEQAVKLFFGDDEKFLDIRRRCMTKDFSWNRSAADYNRMYEKIIDYRGEVELTFEEAFENLKQAYLEVDRKNKEAHPDVVRKSYHRTFQITMNGRAEGTLYVEFKDGQMSVEPFAYEGADAYIDCSYDNLLAMARGEKKTDVLFLSGQLKITGNLARGYEFRNALAPFSALGLKVHQIRKMAKLIDLSREKGETVKAADIKRFEKETAEQAAGEKADDVAAAAAQAVQEEARGTMPQGTSDAAPDTTAQVLQEEAAAAQTGDVQPEAEEAAPSDDELELYEEREQKKEDFKKAAMELKKMKKSKA